MTTKPVPVRVAHTISRSTSSAHDNAEPVQAGPATPADAAHYIAGIAGSLERMAATHQLTFTAYLLGMVVEEARRIVTSEGASQLGADAATR